MESGFIEKHLIYGKVRDSVVRQVYGEIELFAIEFCQLKNSSGSDESDLAAWLAEHQFQNGALDVSWLAEE